MLQKLPVGEKRKIEEEVKREERRELKEVKGQVWKRWRNRKDLRGMVEKMPKEEEKVERKIASIRRKIEEYWTKKDEEEREEKRKKLKKEELLRRKKASEERWAMLRWLTSYIEANKYSWEERKRHQEEI